MPSVTQKKKDVMNDTLRQAMREAAKLTQMGQLKEATLTIQEALGGSGLSPVCNASAPSPQNVLRENGLLTPLQPDVRAPIAIEGIFLKRETEAPLSGGGDGTNDDDVFVDGLHTLDGRMLRYKLYVPPGHRGRALPLVVMLHGCTQDPDDFAAGSGMNDRARVQNFFVLYPAQAQEANPQRCWNWFKRDHQHRGSGEPALLASVTRKIIKQYCIDPRRVYVAGLSAGGAMADILASAYPDIFAAAGVHSGLPCGAATSVAGAFSAMKGGGSRSQPPENTQAARSSVPTIVFHGDQDPTVHPRNGELVVAAVLRDMDNPSVDTNKEIELRFTQGVAEGGRGYSRSIYQRNIGDEVVAEHWLVHGAGHAWSGGSPRGSYTDAKGPDATGEMLRFFFEHSLRNRP